jgi:hypothetical protein
MITMVTKQNKRRGPKVIPFEILLPHTIKWVALLHVWEIPGSNLSLFRQIL